MCGFVSTKISIDDRIRIVKPEESLSIPKVVTVNKFNEEAAAKFSTDMEKAVNTGQPIIPIVIDSFGGHVYSLLAMVDVIKNCPIPVATVAVGKAMSCGAVLLSCGDEDFRFISPNATVMIHDVSNYPGGKLEEIKADVKEAERMDTIIFKLMDSNCGQKSGYFKKLVHSHGHADWFLTPKDVVKHNLANSIKIPGFEVRVGMEVSFS